MNPAPVRTTDPALIHETAPHHPLCWGAVIAGAVAALSLHLLITLFGVGLGIQMIDPINDANPLAQFNLGVGIAWSISALIALGAGGWIAGRLTPEPSRALGALHGLLVWSVATVTAAIVMAGSVGLVVGGAASLAGRGAALAGEQAGNVMSAVAGSETAGEFTDEGGDLLRGFVEELSPPGEDGAEPAVTARAARQIGWALFRLFSTGEEGRTQENQDLVVQAITSSTELSEAEARERVNEWITAYDRIQADLAAAADYAEREAREAADEAADVMTHVAVWTFIAFIIGAVAASFGGRRGSESRSVAALPGSAPRR